ncbi:MAG: NAD(P)/FAD-dependent oxidoreductase [Actinobacteria bacterium]|nr:MAG: NAD(P)/FAD-dependent oxidoreductase [Actinomycetota bacterium]
MSERADVVVVGMGPGGEDLAGKLAEKGLDVIGIDHGLVGGECPYWGCIPSKMMIRAANLLAEARRIPGMAGTSSVTPDWSVVAQRIREEATDDWNDQVAVDRFVKKGGRFMRGSARFIAPGRLSVDGTTVEAPKIAINAGTVPLIPPIPGLSDVHYWTNHHAIETKDLPATLTILGGGPIGLELGQMFGRFGVKVTVVEAGSRILGPEEPESSALLTEVFEREGIVVRTGAAAEKASMDGGDIALSLKDGSTVRGERLLLAVGRRAPLAELNAAAIGVAADAKFLSVDERGRVTDGVWAVGDITGKGNFDPEIGSVGMSEKSARDAGIDVRIGSYPIPRSTRGWIHKAGNDGFIKLIEDRARGVLVGATSAGPTGGEVLSMLTLAVHERITVERLRSMIFAYPTFHRAVEAALDDLLSH